MEYIVPCLYNLYAILLNYLVNSRYSSIYMVNKEKRESTKEMKKWENLPLLKKDDYK